MKKIFAFMLVLAMILSFSACGDGSPKPSPGGDKPETVKLVVGFDAEFPPFGFVAADGSYDGFDLACAKEICSRLGWEFEAYPVDWSYKDNDLKAGTINCIWNGFTYNGRENEYTWSAPYVNNKIVVVVKSDSGIASLADLSGKTVMVQAASSGLDAVNDNSEFKASLGKLIELPDYNVGFLELDQGSVDAVIADLGVAEYNVANSAGNYKVLEEAVSSEEYAIGFLLGDTATRDAVNEKLIEIALDGTMMKIAQDYTDYGLVLESLCLCK